MVIFQSVSKMAMAAPTANQLFQQQLLRSSLISAWFQLQPSQRRFRSKSTLSANNGPIRPIVRINKHMTINYCHQRDEPELPEKPNKASSKLEDQALKPRKQKLVIFMSWLLAKDRHLDKYRQLYFKHGFDVLTVKTGPLDLAFPRRGAQPIAQSLLDYLRAQIHQYPNVLVHGFSVGAYQFSEMLVKLSESLANGDELDAQSLVVSSNTKGLIFDSAVNMHYIPSGFSRALAGDTRMARFLEKLIRLYMKVFYNMATIHYKRAHDMFHNPPIRAPSLLLVSNKDPVGNPVSNTELAEQWRANGIPVRVKCWDDSKHVSHFYRYPAEYETEITDFLERIDLLD